MTSKTISGSRTTGVTLTTATYDFNPLYVTGTINTATGDGVHGDNTQAWTIGNTGTIKAAAGDGVYLAAGGNVTNGTSSARNALLSGFKNALAIKTVAGAAPTIPTPLPAAHAAGAVVYTAAAPSASHP